MKTQAENQQAAQASRETLHDASFPKQREAARSLAMTELTRQAFYRRLVEQVPAILWSTDPDLRVVFSRGAGLADLGLRPGEIVGMSLFRYFRTDDPEFPAIAAHRWALSGEAVTCHAEWKGRTYEALVEPSLRPDGTVAGCTGLALDLTRVAEAATAQAGRVRAEEALQRSEAQLRQAQKMEAVGRLTGGVVHDFNNLLMAILGYSDMLLNGLAPDDPMRGDLEQIQDAGERAALLTSQLLRFSRSQVLQPRVLDLNPLVADTEKLLHRLIGEDIELVTVLDPAAGRVKADPGQVNQVVLNLVVNARDAMPQGGTLTLSTSNVHLDETEAWERRGVQPGAYVRLAVRDTGCGMTPEVQARLFEPFFTTKQPGAGTGLGLATVHDIVRQGGGHLAVASEPGQGTTFEVYWPQAEDAAGVPESAAAPSELPRGAETVLVAEDDEGVRTLIHNILRHSGYTVILAQDGVEAGQVAARHDGPIHLLVTDVVMPRMGGRPLAERLAILRPEMRVLYLSGYTDEAVIRHGVVKAKTQFLQKPFTPEVLVRRVREMLDTAPTARR